MATFYYNRFSNENNLSQWRRYLQNQTRDFSEIISVQTREINESIQSASEEQLFAIQQSTDAVCGTLDSGFELLAENLQDISFGIGEVRSELNEMASMLDWKLSLLIEQQRITDLLLGNIAVLLRIPDIQKERQYHIEQGIKFLKNAFFDNDFYEDALKNLLKAETIEPSDFFALHRIGLIYMYSPNHLQLNKAEEYFRKAAKYAVAETNAGASITTNYLTGDVNQNLLTQIPTVDSIKLQAAESYMFAGRSCYVQGKFGDAAELAGKGFSIVPNIVEAGFTQAKALSADNKTSQAAIVLKSVIERDRFYSIKSASDLDLSPKTEIKDLLENFRQKAFADASNLLSECKDNMIPESIAKEEISKIEKLVNRKTFLHCKKAIDLLINKNVERTFSDIFQTSKRSSYKANRNLNELQGELSEISKKVKYPERDVPTIKTLFNFLSQNTQWNFLQITTFTEALNFSSGCEPKKLTSPLIIFTKKEKEYFDKLSSAKSQIKKTVEEIYNDDVVRRNADAQTLANKQRAEKEAKNKASVRYAISNAYYFGVYGLVFGGLIGYGKGCKSYADHHGSLLEPFRYIPEYALTVGIIAAIIGIIIGVIKGQKKV